MVKLFFLGTGGGRINVVKQFRSTAGFIIDGSSRIYVDPGPGAIFQAKKFRFNLEKIDVLFISHPHLDHVNDAQVVIEAMTHLTRKRRGFLVAEEIVLRGSRIRERATGLTVDIIGSLTPFKPKYETYIPSISPYHKSLLEGVFTITPNKEVEIERLKSKIKFKGTLARHDCPTTGFVVEIDGKKIGYTADTEYFEGVGEQYKGCDALVVNILRVTKPWAGHLYKDSAIKLLKEAMPKKTFLTRFGGEYLRIPAIKVAKEIQQQTGIETIATYDGMNVEI
jgi:ribonuclease BN (tRNA processing enzyme)